MAGKFNFISTPHEQKRIMRKNLQRNDKCDLIYSFSFFVTFDFSADDFHNYRRSSAFVYQRWDAFHIYYVTVFSIAFLVKEVEETKRDEREKRNFHLKMCMWLKCVVNNDLLAFSCNFVFSEHSKFDGRTPSSSSSLLPWMRDRDSSQDRMQMSYNGEWRIFSFLFRFVVFSKKFLSFRFVRSKSIIFFACSAWWKIRSVCEWNKITDRLKCVILGTPKTTSSALIDEQVRCKTVWVRIEEEKVHSTVDKWFLTILAQWQC